MELILMILSYVHYVKLPFSFFVWRFTFGLDVATCFNFALAGVHASRHEYVTNWIDAKKKRFQERDILTRALILTYMYPCVWFRTLRTWLLTGSPLSFVYSIEMGIAQTDVNWFYTSDEIADNLTKSNFTERFCEKLAHCAVGSVTIFVKGKKYLTRHFMVFKQNYAGTNVFLHHFHSSDLDVNLLHNHPFKWGISLILTRGYIEESLDERTGVLVRKLKKPWRFNFVSVNKFHRVDLLDERRGCWTLFLAGPRIQNWSFYDKIDGTRKPRSINPGSIT